MCKRLIIFTHVTHYQVDCDLLAHGPYVNEINVLSKRVDEVVVVAPFVTNAAKISADNLPYKGKWKLISLPVVGGDSLMQKLNYLWFGPLILFRILKGLSMHGILHPRSPGSIGFIALVLIAILARHRRKFAKFAGEWDSPATLPITFRWQRDWLANKILFNGPVFAYTSGCNASHIVPSFTSSLTQDVISTANDIGKSKEIKDRLIIVFAGRLVKNKGVDVLLDALAILDRTRVSWELFVIGDGVEQANWKRQAESLGIAAHVNWLGWCSQKSMMTYLALAHIVCQPTRFSESWGKVLQEGMAFGCVPVASAVGGLKKQLVEKPELLFEPGNSMQCAEIIESIACGRFNFDEIKRWSIARSQLYSLDALSKFTWNKYDVYYSS